MKKKICIFAVTIIGVFFAASLLSAQTTEQVTSFKENSYSIKLETRSYGDSVVLRWMVDDPAVWMLANRDGWRIIRTGGKHQTAKVEHIVKPWELSKISSMFGYSDLQAGAIAQAIYAESAIPKSLSSKPETLVEYVCRLREEHRARQTIVSMLACRSELYADAAGLRFVDSDVEAGATYEYTLSYNGKSDIFSCSVASEIVKNLTTDAMSAGHAIKEVSVKQINAGKLAIYWPVSDFCGYYIERAYVSKIEKSDETKLSTNKTKSRKSSKSGADLTIAKASLNFEPLNRVPVVKTDILSTADYPCLAIARDNVVFFDSLKPGQTAVYRVRGYDLFGRMSDWCQSDAATMLEQHPLASPELVRVSETDSNGCSVEWRISSDVAYSAFVLAFSGQVDGDWSNVSGKLSSDSRMFTDSNAIKRGVGYYRLYAYDSLGRLSYSNVLPNSLVDSVALAAPQALRGNSLLLKKDDKSEQKSFAVVSLKWNEPKKRPGDLLGFRVFFADRRDGTFAEVSPSVVAQYSFSDTINVSDVTTSVYYYVVAVDSRYNQSVSSDTVKVDLPDVVCPEPCEWKSTMPGDTKTSIKWYRSRSEDVVKYNVYSKSPSSSSWRWVASIDSTSFGASPCVTYNVENESLVFPVHYSIEAVDAAGNTSARGGVVALPANKSADAGISLNAKFNRKAASVSLEWKYTSKPDGKFVGVIYRSDDGSEPVAVGAFSPSQTSFTDSRLPKAKTVTYHIVLKESQSSVSKPSAAVRVSLN